MAPQIKVCIKAHKNNQPIRPVINNIQAPSYKPAQFMNRKLEELFSLPYEINNSGYKRYVCKPTNNRDHTNS
jgi:hypothetical protein